MADQDFQINIRTLADTTGIKLTQQQLEALQTAAANGNKQAIAALKQLSDAQRQAQREATVGFSGSAVGVGTIVTLLTTAINKWKQFNDEQDREVTKMLEALEKRRQLAESILDLFEAARSEARIDTEPLEQSFSRLTNDIIRLKTEMQLAFEAGAYEDVKKLNGELRVEEGQLRRVTSEIERQAAIEKKAADDRAKAAEKEFRDRESFRENAITNSSTQTKAVLENELAAQRARQAGDEKSADMFQKSAEAFEKSMTPAQREELESLRRGIPEQPVGRRAEAGESQAAVDQIERNRINFERQQRGEAPLPEQGKDAEILGVLQQILQEFR